MDENMINTLNSMLQEGNIPDNIKDIMSNLTNNSNEKQTNSSSTNIDTTMLSSLLSSFKQTNTEASEHSSSVPNNIDMDTILKMKTIIDKINKNQNDPRANLLRSLKPYLRNSRKDKLEQYVKLLNMTNIMETFGNNRW